MKNRRTFIMRNSMESLKTATKEKIAESRETLNTMQENGAEITTLGTGLDSISPDLDDSITSAIQEAKQAGKEQAIRDVTELQNQINQDMADVETLKGQVDTNISENNTAKSTLESLKSNKYGGGIDLATSEIEANNAVGEAIKSDADTNYQAIGNDAQSVRDIINEI